MDTDSIIAIIIALLSLAGTLVALSGTVYVAIYGQKKETERKFLEYILENKFKVLTSLNSKLGECWLQINPMPWQEPYIDLYWQGDKNEEYVAESCRLIWIKGKELQRSYAEARVYFSKEQEDSISKFMLDYAYVHHYIDIKYRNKNWDTISEDLQKTLTEYTESISSSYAKANNALRELLNEETFLQNSDSKKVKERLRNNSVGSKIESDLKGLDYLVSKPQKGPDKS